MEYSECRGDGFVAFDGNGNRGLGDKGGGVDCGEDEEPRERGGGISDVSDIAADVRVCFRGMRRIGWWPCGRAHNPVNNDRIGLQFGSALARS